jgi:hypothetical protein
VGGSGEWGGDVEELKNIYLSVDREELKNGGTEKG